MSLQQLSIEEYGAAPGVRKSELDLLHRSPAHLQAHRLCPKEPTAAMEWGSAFHTFILQPDVFEATYAVIPEGIDRRFKEGKEAWAAWEDENKGKHALAKPDMQQLSAMRDALFANQKVAGILVGGLAEQSAFCLRDGVETKVRPDYLRPDLGLMVDLKTCVDARPDAFSKSCWDYRYHVQAPFYLDAIDGYEQFLFIAIEKTEPYGIGLYLASDAMMKQGRIEYHDDLSIYRECLSMDIWPAYTDNIYEIDLPRWAQMED